MSKLRYAIVAIAMALAFVFVGFPASSAHAQITRPFSSGFQVQNLSTTQADITVEFFPEQGTAASASVPATIPGSGNVTFATLPSAVTAGFRGSATIASNQRIAAIVNIVSPDSSISFGGEAYVGVTGGSTSVSLPLLFKNASGFSTFFNVQNVSTAPATFTVTYSGGGLAAPVSEPAATLQPGAAQRFDQSANAQLPAGFDGSAIITSDQDVAAAVVQVGPTTILSYNGFSGGTTNPVFPLINARNFGFITGISLQNVGTEATDVTVSYTPSAAGTACTETQTVAPGGTGFYALFTLSGSPGGEGITSNCSTDAAFVGSAAVTANSANQPLVAIVNQLNGATNKGGAYSSFDTANASSTVVFPLIQDRVFGFFTGTSIVNVGTVATPVECTFTDSTETQGIGTLAPGATFTAQQLNLIGDRYNGSGTCVATASGAQIIGIANQLNGGSNVDQFFVYEGANN